MPSEPSLVPNDFAIRHPGQPDYRYNSTPSRQNSPEYRHVLIGDPFPGPLSQAHMSQKTGEAQTAFCSRLPGNI